MTTKTIPSFGSRSLCALFLSLLAHLIAVAASPNPAVNPTHVAPDPVLTKRVKLEVPPFGKDYNGRVKKGEWLNGLFSLNDEDAKKWASPYQNPDELFDWGWTPYVQAPWLPLQEGQKVRKPEFGDKLDAAFKDPEFPVDKEKLALYRFVHDKEFEYKDGRKGEPTEARYYNVASPQDGAFIFDSNWSPTYQRKEDRIGDVPDLDTLSDLAYFQWRDSCQAVGVEFGSLKVIFRSNIYYAPTFNTIIETMRQADYSQVPGWDKRVTFSMDSQEGHAILGSAHGASTAWFLIQHREELGAKRLKEVVVWGATGAFGLDMDMEVANLTLRFTVTNA
ncbi:hypothetical protein CDEST_08665 [Colletotrichum destructivum]|uniref:WD domain-containing protein n=1 Tax=Colletotrichum destructivum TaxID=34406 RepID=A0AAX4IL49_9PEZI|nr:hypothetical protein CDEST_08665 [Colletotrichum destructivum]